MNDFERWTRGTLGHESKPNRPTRRREAWQAKHDQIFKAVWGEQQSSRTFPQPRRDPLPTIQPTRHTLGNRPWLVLLLAFAAGAGLAWLLK